MEVCLEMDDTDFVPFEKEEDPVTDFFFFEVGGVEECGNVGVDVLGDGGDAPNVGVVDGEGGSCFMITRAGSEPLRERPKSGEVGATEEGEEFERGDIEGGGAKEILEFELCESSLLEDEAFGDRFDDELEGEVDSGVADRLRKERGLKKFLSFLEERREGELEGEDEFE